MRNQHIVAAVVGVAAAVALAYGPSLHNQFVNWDDDAHLLWNPFVQSLNLRDIFTTTVNGIYIPLTMLSLAIEYHFFQNNPFVYHFNNLLLHLAVTGMVVVFSLRCGLSLRASVAAGLMFGLHPMHVESVAWVTQRKDVLYALFFMLALLCYVSHLRAIGEGSGSPKRWPFRCTLLFGLLSVLAKPMALSLPLALFVCDWFFRRKATVRSCMEKIYCGLAVIPVAWITYVSQMRTLEVRFPESALIWIWCFVFYIQKTFFPDYFVLIYHLPAPASLANPGYGLAVFIFFALTASVVLFRKNRLFVFAYAFYVVSIFFLLRLDHRADINVVGDRFMYLPMLGWCLLVGAGYDRLFVRYQHTAARTGIALLGLAVLVFLFFQTTRQLRVWYNGASLWEHQLRYQRQAATALIYSKLAESYAGEPGFTQNPARMRMVMDYVQQAIAIKPDYAQAYFQLGRLWMLKGNTDVARESFEKAVRFDGEHFEAYFQLGKLYDGDGQHEQAIQAFRQAVTINPDNKRLYKQVLDFYDEAIAAGGKMYGQEQQHVREEYARRFSR